ncbi:hypothetical protein ACLBYG_22255 [Methylobacterium sp. D53M]
MSGSAPSVYQQAASVFVASLPRNGAVIVVADDPLRLILSGMIVAARPTEADRFWFIVASAPKALELETHARLTNKLPVLRAPGHGFSRARRRALAADLRAA